jgi:hypothetical protein
MLRFSSMGATPKQLFHCLSQQQQQQLGLQPASEQQPLSWQQQAATHSNKAVLKRAYVLLLWVEVGQVRFVKASPSKALLSATTAVLTKPNEPSTTTCIMNRDLLQPQHVILYVRSGTTDRQRPPPSGAAKFAAQQDAPGNTREQVSSYRDGTIC